MFKPRETQMEFVTLVLNGGIDLSTYVLAFDAIFLSFIRCAKVVICSRFVILLIGNGKSKPATSMIISI